MNINKLMPTVMGIIIITLLALATSCSSQKKFVGHYYNKSTICPTYH